jgi:FkbM family methyltransferase
MTPPMSKNSVRTAKTRYGELSHFVFDDPIGRSLDLYGEWAQLEIDFLCQFVRPGDTVIDVGANVGTHTLALARAVGPTGRIIALEPQPAVFDLLRSNLHLNHLDAVDARCVAISSEPGTQLLKVPDYGQRHNSGMATLDGRDGTRVEVPTIRLDDLGVSKCSLIKLDIEGWEDRAITGGTALIQACQPLIYAECNSVENGWRLNQAIGRDHAMYLHSPRAFNANNFAGNTENVFGGAEETNLLFLPRARLSALELILSRQEHLVRIESLDDLALAFMRASRYGDAEIRPERTQALSRRVSMLEHELVAARQQGDSQPSAQIGPAARVSPALTRPVHVIVPVYNGLRDFERLTRSLFEAHPEPTPLLRFVFINDASPDPSVAAFLDHESFLRPDVTVLTNPANLGFVGTVNRGLDVFGLGPGGTDVIILNTDTLVFGGVFSVLQNCAYRLPNVASVTPVTNNGTIASVLNWPHGGELFSLLEPETVARSIERAGVRAPLVDVPTGVGFCMYMTHAALQKVGAFDTAFGRGYGEENSWCQTAAKRGFVNLITTEAFVYHHGSQSFGDDTKKRQLEKNLLVLQALHPNYLADVEKHISSDPHRGARASLLWAMRRDAKTRLHLRTFLFLLHTDPGYGGGGTERHVSAITDRLLSEGRSEVLHLYPDARTGQWLLRAFLPRGVGEQESRALFLERFDEADLISLLECLACDVDTIHVHHLLNWPSWFPHIPALFAKSRKLITLHDFFALCPSIRLTAGGRYCQVPTDLTECNRCLRDTLDVPATRIEDYRGNWVRCLEQFDEVLTPSESARAILTRGFGTVGKPPTIRVVPNFLLGHSGGERPSLEPRGAWPSPRVVFLGAFAESKGSRLFASAAREMRARGWTLEVWGALGQPLPEGVTHREYMGSDQLRALARAYPCDVVVLPAIWPETYSFTTFEAALDVGAPVVVGPYGNPPEVVRKHGIGIVLNGLTVEALLDGVARALSNRFELSGRLLAFATASRSLDVEQYLDAAYSRCGEARAVEPLGRLPTPALPRPLAGTRTPPPALRHQLIDQTNEFLKRRTPWLHSNARYLGSWCIEQPTRAVTALRRLAKRAEAAEPPTVELTSEVPPSLRNKAPQTGGHVNLENLDRLPFPQNARVVRGRPNLVDGWSFADSVDLATPSTESYVVLRSTKSEALFFAPVVKRERRDDVVGAYSNSAQSCTRESGFRLGLRTDGLPPGEYHFGMVHVSRESATYGFERRTLLVE